MNIRLLITILGVAFLQSCGGGSDSGDSNTKDLLPDGSPSSFSSDCGAVLGSELVNPVSSSEAEFVASVSVITGNLVTLNKDSGPQAVKLFGLSEAGSKSESAVAFVQNLASQGVYFVPQSSTCSVAVNGGVGTTGQLYSASGKNIAEEVIKAGLVGSIEGTGTCGENLIASCYQALYDSYAPKTAGEIRDFLWKPKAESPYNPGGLVIHAGPCNASVYVNGTALLDYGPGNGRCNTSRSSRTGCAWGGNVKVEIFDNETGAAYTHNGLPYIIVPNGCNRFEFKF